MFSRTEITVFDFGHFLLWSTIRNTVGGSVFVGLLKYGHGIHGGTSPENVDVDEGTAEQESG